MRRTIVNTCVNTCVTPVKILPHQSSQLSYTCSSILHPLGTSPRQRKITPPGFSSLLQAAKTEQNDPCLCMQGSCSHVGFRYLIDKVNEVIPLIGPAFVYERDKLSSHAGLSPEEELCGASKLVSVTNSSWSNTRSYLTHLALLAEQPSSALDI